MNDTLEIRWHGRGGQGVKTASLLLADVAFFTGKYVQGFPEYGPERMGAPVTAYNRIAGQPIRLHSNIYEPKFVAVVDETLLATVDVTAGLCEEGGIVVNTQKGVSEIIPYLDGYKGKVCTINARSISERILGKYFPNMPMLAAMVKLTQIMEEPVFLEKMEISLHHKFATKPQAVQGNLTVLRCALEEVNGL